jgi:hypothetical protein
MFDSKDELFADDRWHCIEACFKLNTLDLKNDRPTGMESCAGGSMGIGTLIETT